MRDRLAGVFAIMPTPFDAKGRVDVESLCSLTAFEVQAGVSGLTVLGILGEYQKLTEQERDLVVRTVVDQTAGRVPVVVGTSAGGTDLAIHYSCMARDAGATGLMVAPPPNLKGLDAVREYYDRIGRAIDLPIVIQDEPLTTGVLMPAAFLTELLREVVATCAIKLEEPPTPTKASRILNLMPDAAILGGLGGLYFLEELNRGCVGTMTGFAFPEVLVDIWRRFQAGDWEGASTLFYRYMPLIRYEAQQGVGLAIRKEIFRRRGIISCAALRHPGIQLDRDGAIELTRLLEAVGEGPQRGEMER